MTNVLAVVVFALLFFGGGIAVAVFARNRGRSGRVWATLSALLSPPLAFLLLLLPVAKDHHHQIGGLI